MLYRFRRRSLLQESLFSAAALALDSRAFPMEPGLQNGIGVSNKGFPISSLSPEMHPLRFYIGDWVYSEVYEKSAFFPDGGRNTGSWTGQAGPRGLSVINTFVSHGTGDNYEGMEVMMWDPKMRLFRDHALWYDSSDRWVFTGQFEADVLVYYGEYEYGGHIKFRSETRPRIGGGFTLDEFASVDGGPEHKTLRGIAEPR